MRKHTTSLGLIGLVWIVINLHVIVQAQELRSQDPATIGASRPLPNQSQSDGALRLEGRQPLATPPPQVEGREITLDRIRIEGNSAISDEELAETLQPFLGQTLPLAALWDAAAAVTAHYRDAGYILSRAIVVPQEINRSATLRVIEGYISDVSIPPGQEGPNGRPDLIEHMRQKILQSRPLQITVLERYMLLLNDLPGVSAQSILRPDPLSEGAAQLLIQWKEAHFLGALSLDNFSSDDLGPVQASGIGVASNLYNQYDRTTLRGLVSSDLEEVRFISLRHELPIGSEGTVISVEGSHTDTDPGGDVSQLNIDGKASMFGVTASHPIIRSRRHNLTVAGAFRLLESESELDDNFGTKDRIRRLEVGASYDFIDRYLGVNLASFSVTQGLDILDARGRGEEEPDPSRENGAVDFTKFNLTLSREQSLTRGFVLYLAATGQYALKSLLAPEEFGFGGFQFGRGLDPFAISGDHGLAGTVQIQYGRAIESALLDAVNTFAFFDAGRTWRRDGEAFDDNVSASSVGAGVEFNAKANAFGAVILALPVDGAPNDDNDPRLLFRISKRF